ncbi:hypothetical protein [Microbacterium terricola]|uniref:hypothetical protein n=1 Tax=Microbacterium terricola TaxID=344163 RepID=UPI0021E8A884|nr:hypothetical protein [Microbacterium terricola]UYK39668.1 hypothetical protein OAU46_13340 [Microbacterium terricola]
MSLIADRPLRPATELLWVGDGGWVACDTALAKTDPRRVIAFIECKEHRVRVQWVRDRCDVSVHDTLREALQAVEAACTRDREASPERSLQLH